MRLDPRPSHRPRRWLLLLAAALLAAGLGCGIDDHSDEDDDGSGGGSGTAPDISGLYDGFFFSRETDEAIGIDQVVFIRTSTTIYQADFDIDTEEGTDPVAVALETILNLSRVEGVVDTQSNLFIEAAQGLLVMNGRVRDGGRSIDGDWLLNTIQDGELLEDSGTWEIFRRAR